MWGNRIDLVMQIATHTVACLLFLIVFRHAVAEDDLVADTVGLAFAGVAGVAFDGVDGLAVALLDDANMIPGAVATPVDEDDVAGLRNIGVWAELAF